MGETFTVTEDYLPNYEFFVGIDSDGCVFDTMELKHKECFIPAFINHYELQGVSKYAANPRSLSIYTPKVAGLIVS